MKEPEFLSVEDVLAIHARQLAAHGGREGLRDRGLLESAVATPQATFGGAYLHEDVFAMAAAYAFHIAQNQPFVDGNKRAALASALVFLRLEGFAVRAEASVLYAGMIGIATGSHRKEDLAAMFRAHAARMA